MKFRSGRHERGWVGHVVAVGNASGFVEPLEATALAQIIYESRWLAESLRLTGGRPDDAMRASYNRLVGIAWDEIRDFLAFADQRVGGRCVTGLTDTDAHAHDQETPETAHQPVDRCQPAPGRQPPTHQLGARTGIGHPPQRQPGNRIDNGEGGTDDAQLKVAEVPFHTDRLNDDGRNGAIEEVEQIGQEQQEQNAPGIRRLGRVLHGSVSLLLLGRHFPRNLQSRQACHNCL